MAYFEALRPAPDLIPLEPRARARATWFDEFADTIFFACVSKMFFNRIVAPISLGRSGDLALAAKAEMEIPADVVDALRLPLELAVSLYAQRILGLGKAAHLADLSRWEMNRVLAQRQVLMHYGPEELAEDLHHGRGDQ